MKATICNRFVSAPGKVKVQLLELQGFDLDPVEVDSVAEALKRVPDGVEIEMYLVPHGTVLRQPSDRLEKLAAHRMSPIAHAYTICGHLRDDDDNNLQRRRREEALQVRAASLPPYTIEELQNAGQ